MSLREIGAKLTLEGEAEWNREMKAADRELANLKSELAATSAEFAGQANTIEALRAKQKLQQEQTAQQAEKVRALAEAVESATEMYGENSEQVDKLTQKYNYARASLSNMEEGLKETSGYLEEAEAAADGCASSIDGFGKKVKAAENPTRRTAGAVDELAEAEQDAAGGAGGLLGTIQKLVPQLNTAKLASNLTAAGILGGVGSAFKKAWDWAMGLVESTADLRKELAELEISCAAAGATLDDDLHSAMKIVYEATGDMSSAFKTVSTLLQADYSGSGMLEALDELRGAVIAFPDTLKIDSLAEGLQKTLSTGTADGQFKDMLERLGVDVDDFQTKLADCSTAAERQQVVLDTLASSGLRELTEEYRAARDSAVALSDATYDLEMANARLAESFEPVKARVTEARARFTEFMASEFGKELASWRGAFEPFYGVINTAARQSGMGAQDIEEVLAHYGLSFEDFAARVSVSGQSAGEVITDLAKAMQAEAEATSRAESKTAALHEAAMSRLGKTNDAVQDAVGKLAELQAQYEGIRAGIDRTVDGFTNLNAVRDSVIQSYSEKGDMKEVFDEMLSGLNSQIGFLDKYADYIQRAREMGLSDALIEELSDGSMESRVQLQAIVEAGEDSIQELNEKFAAVEEGKQAFVDTVAEALPGFQDTLDEITATLDSAAEQWPEIAEDAGYDTIDGLLAGLDRYDEVFAMGVQMAEAFNAGYKSAQDQHSPSRRARKMMGDTIEGLIIGGKDRMGDMSDLGGQLADSLWTDYRRASELAAATVRVEAVGPSSDAAASRLDALTATVAAIAGDLRDGIPVVLEDGTAIGRLTRRIDRELWLG